MTLETKIKTILTADASSFEAGVSRATSSLKRAEGQWEKSTKSAGAGFNLLGLSVTNLAAIFAGFSARNFVASLVQTADELKTLSERTGVAVSTLESLRFPLQDAGGSLAGFGTSINIMQNNIGELANGTKSAAENFSRLGISFNELRGLSTEQQFFKIADSISKLGTEYERTEAARNFFGRGAASLIPTINAANGATQEYLLAQAGLSARFNDDVRLIDELGDAWTRTAMKIKQDAIGALGELIRFLRLVRDEFGALSSADLMAESAKAAKGIQRARKNLDSAIANPFISQSGEDRYRKDLQSAIDRYTEIQIELSRAARAADASPAGEAPTGALPTQAADTSGQSKLDTLYEKNIEYIEGIDAATKKYQKSISELDELLMAGVVTQGEYAAAVERIGIEYEENKLKADKWAIDLEAITKRAAENMQDAFADFLFDPFSDGLDGMLKGFVDVLRKMVAEQASAQLFGSINTGGGGLGDLLGGALGGGGLLGGQGGLSRLFGTGNAGFVGPMLPMFADGGFLGAGQWGITGEEGAELTYGGRTGKTIIPMDDLSGGKNHYVFNVGGDVSQQQFQQLQAMVQATAGVGVIEKRVANAQKRGALA